MNRQRMASAGYPPSYSDVFSVSYPQTAPSQHYPAQTTPPLYPATTSTPPPEYVGPTNCYCPPQQVLGNSSSERPPGQYQQPPVVAVAAHQQPIVEQQSYVGHITIACVIFWCWNWVFGLIAFILAVVASRAAVSDPLKARKLGNASLAVSCAGAMVTFIILAIVLVVSFVTAAHGHNIMQSTFGNSGSV